MNNSIEKFANQVIEYCDSTNDLAKRLGDLGAPHGTWVSSRIQKKGRGRMGRSWASLEGNLFLSLIVRPRVLQNLMWIPLTAAVGAALKLREIFPSLEVQIKWPNDLWIDGAKVGGVLCEGIGNRAEMFVVVGLGLNCVRAPKNLDQKTTSLSEEVLPARLVHADDVRLEMIKSCLMTLERLEVEGPSYITSSYESLSVFQQGMWIEWGDAQEGRVVGLGPSGELIVKHLDHGMNGNDRTVRLYAEDVKVRRRVTSDNDYGGS